MQRRRKPVWALRPPPPRILRWGPPRTVVLTSTCLYPFLTLFLPLLFNSKSIELLIGSGEVLLVYYIQRWRRGAIILKAGEQGISLQAEWAKNFLTATISVGPFPFNCIKPFRFRVTLLHLYRAFCYHMVPVMLVLGLKESLQQVLVIVLECNFFRR